MSQSLRIAVADDEPDMREYFQRFLPRLGHKVITVAENGKELVDRCLADWPDLVITDIKMPEMDGIDAAVALYRARPVPVILVSAHHSPDYIDRAEKDHIMGYLVKPIKVADLEPTLALTMRRFHQFEELHRETADLRRALQERLRIERAKEVLRQREGLAEDQACRRLREIAAEQGRRLVEAADLILAAAATEQAAATVGEG